MQKNVFINIKNKYSMGRMEQGEFELFFLNNISPLLCIGFGRPQHKNMAKISIRKIAPTINLSAIFLPLNCKKGD